MSEYQAIQKSDIVSPYTASVERVREAMDTVEVPRKLYDTLVDRDYNVDWAVVSRESLVVNQGTPSMVTPSSLSGIVVSVGEEGDVRRELERPEDGVSTSAIVKFLSQDIADRFYREDPI